MSHYYYHVYARAFIAKLLYFQKKSGSNCVLLLGTIKRIQNMKSKGLDKTQARSLLT